MVQVINMPSRSTLLGQQLGAGAAKGLSAGTERLMQRDFARRGFDEAEAAIESGRGPEGQVDPIKMLMGLLRASAVAPEVGKSVGLLYPEVLKSMMAQQKGGALRAGSEALRTASPAQTQQEVGPDVASILGMNFSDKQQTIEQPPLVKPDVNQKQMVSEQSPSQEKDERGFNTDNYLYKIRPELDPKNEYGKIIRLNRAIRKDMSPDEEADLRDNLFDRGFRPEQIEDTVNRFRQYLSTKTEEDLARYGIDKQEQEALDRRYKEILAEGEKNLPSLLKGFEEMPETMNEFKNKFNEYASQQPSNLTPEESYARSAQMILDDKDNLNKVANLPALPPVHEGKSFEEANNAIKVAYQPLLKKGYYRAVRDDYVEKKGGGVEDFHKLLYGDQTDSVSLKRLSDIPFDKFKPEPLMIGKIPKGDLLKRYEKGLEQVNDISIKSLLKIKPKDDLILLRKAYLEAGGDVSGFLKALNEAEKKGLKLSRFQENQRAEVATPYKPPLFEFFTEPGTATSRWFNYFRKKR